MFMQICNLASLVLILTQKILAMPSPCLSGSCASGGGIGYKGGRPIAISGACSGSSCGGSKSCTGSTCGGGPKFRSTIGGYSAIKSSLGSAACQGKACQAVCSSCSTSPPKPQTPPTSPTPPFPSNPNDVVNVPTLVNPPPSNGGQNQGNNNGGGGQNQVNNNGGGGQNQGNSNGGGGQTQGNSNGGGSRESGSTSVDVVVSMTESSIVNVATLTPPPPASPVPPVTPYTPSQPPVVPPAYGDTPQPPPPVPSPTADINIPAPAPTGTQVLPVDQPSPISVDQISPTPAGYTASSASDSVYASDAVLSGAKGRTLETRSLLVFSLSILALF